MGSAGGGGGRGIDHEAGADRAGAAGVGRFIDGERTEPVPRRFGVDRKRHFALRAVEAGDAPVNLLRRQIGKVLVVEPHRDGPAAEVPSPNPGRARRRHPEAHPACKGRMNQLDLP